MIFHIQPPVIRIETIQKTATSEASEKPEGTDPDQIADAGTDAGSVEEDVMDQHHETKADTEAVTLRLPKSLIGALKHEARKQAFEQNRDITYTDLIRELLGAKFGGEA